MKHYFTHGDSLFSRILYCIEKTSENYPIDLKTSQYMFLGSILIHKSQANKEDLLFDELNSANLNYFALTMVTTRKVFVRFHHVLHSSEEKNQPVWGAKLWGEEIKSRFASYLGQQNGL